MTEEMDKALTMDGEDLALVTVQVQTVPDPRAPDDYIIRSSTKVERQDGDVPGQVTLAACITAVEKAHETLKEAYEEMYGSTDGIRADVVAKGKTSVVTKDGHEAEIG